MGLDSLEPTQDNLSRFGLAVTLGGGEVRLIDLVSAYSAFANGGHKTEPIAILEVKDTKGKTLFRHKSSSNKKVLPEEVSFLISHILMDENAREMTFGRGSYLNIPGYEVAVKTGTTDDKRDNWTVGWAPNIIVGVWVGNNDNSPMANVASGTSGASPIWNSIIRTALKNLDKQSFKKPDKVIAVEIDSLTGGLPIDGQPKRTEYFIKGTEPTNKSPYYKKIKVSKSDNNKLANELEIASGDYDQKEFIIFTESDPVSTDDKNRWQIGIDQYINSVEPYKSDSRFHPPTETSTAKENELRVAISKPENHQKIDDNDIKIETEAFSINKITEIKIEVDGIEKYKKNQSSISTYLNLSDGPHTIKIIAKDEKGNQGESEVKIGVKQNWDYQEPTPSPAPIPTNPVPTSTPILAPISISPAPTLTPA